MTLFPSPTNQRLKPEQMLQLFQEMTALCLKIETNLHIQTSINIDAKKIDFEITVFDKEHDNCFFSFYPWQTIAEIKQKIKTVLTTIKTDSYEQIVQLSNR